MDLTALFDILNSGWGLLAFLPILGYICWKNPYEYNTFAECVAAIGSSEGTIMIPNEQAVTDNLTIPANVTLKFIHGGSLNIAVGKTLTINGHVEAGLYKIFKGTGSVVFAEGAVKETYSEWGTTHLLGSLLWDPANLVDGAGETSGNITAPGAAVGKNRVVVFPPYSLQGILCRGYVSAANTVNIRIQNETGGAINLVEGTWLVKVLKY